MRRFGFRDVPNYWPEFEWLAMLGYSIAFVIASAMASSAMLSLGVLSAGGFGPFWRIGISYVAWWVLAFLFEFCRRADARRRGIPFISVQAASDVWMRWIREEPWGSSLRISLVIVIAAVLGFIPLEDGVPFWAMSWASWKLSGVVALGIATLNSAFTLAHSRWDFTRIRARRWALTIAGLAAAIVLIAIASRFAGWYFPGIVGEVLAGLLGLSIALCVISRRW